jgi:hypothetical protein
MFSARGIFLYYFFAAVSDGVVIVFVSSLFHLLFEANAHNRQDSNFCTTAYLSCPNSPIMVIEVTIQLSQSHLLRTKNGCVHILYRLVPLHETLVKNKSVNLKF